MLKQLKRLRSQSIDMLVFSFPDGGTPSEENLDWKIEYDQATQEYRIMDQDILVHRSRVFHSSRLLRNFHFEKPLITIGDCFTDDRYRGKGIYPYVLRKIAKQYAHTTQVFILVAPDNIPSIKGIEKAGFQFTARLRSFRFLVFYFRKRISITRK
jgi:RimJ/RimL family protein N-acetyltransferase